MSSGPEVHTVELDTGSNCDLPDARNDAMATNAVLDFILGLLRDEESFNAYCGNPQAAVIAHRPAEQRPDKQRRHHGRRT